MGSGRASVFGGQRFGCVSWISLQLKEGFFFGGGRRFFFFLGGGEGVLLLLVGGCK